MWAGHVLRAGGMARITHHTSQTPTVSSEHKKVSFATPAAMLLARAMVCGRS
jgi:hypothetical protein